MAKQEEVKKIVSLILSLSMILSLITFVPASVYADEETLETEQGEAEALEEVQEEAPGTAAQAEAAATFKNTTDDGGLDVINLCEERTFKAMIPISSGSDVDAEQVVWSLDRDLSKEYVSKEQYPNQKAGGTLDTWMDSGRNPSPLFKDIVTEVEEQDGQSYLTVTFGNKPYFSSGSAPHAAGGAYLDVCGYFDLTAKQGSSEIGSVSVTVVPYDNFHTMDQVYEELDEMVMYAKANTNIYVQKFSMGKSSGVIYDALDMPYIIVAKDEKAVSDWLKFTDDAEKDPEKVLADIEAGVYNDIKVPVMYSNIHSNEVAAVDGIIEFAWTIIEAANENGNGNLSYDTLTGFTDEGKAQLETEMGTVGAKGSVAIPDLVKDKATYLGYLKAGNRNSDVVALSQYYNVEEKNIDVDELLDDVFFILVPEENVEGRTYITRTASNGYDLNRDNSFQTTSETQNMQKLIGTYNPVSFTEFHGMIAGFQVEPCDPPHEPNFEYDLLAEHLLPGGEALGIAAVANNKRYNSYTTPQRDYLSYTGNKTADGQDETYWVGPWDDMSTSYTPQFAMLHGTVAYTVELPGYNDDGAELVKYGCIGQSDYIAGEKLGYIKDQVKIYERGVNNANSNAFGMVGQWFCNQYDVEGAESNLFRPEYNGEGENGNFYPEFYIIPLDSKNQKNLDAAYDMMEWLSRNDVKIKVTNAPYTYDGVTYPAGTMIVSMHQAKRSVANGALYDGTLITSWTELYSEGITSFAETRGFDMITVAKEAEFSKVMGVCGSAMDHSACLSYIKSKTSQFTGTSGRDVIIKNTSVDAAAAVNALLKAGETVGMVTDEGSAYYGDFICSYKAWQSISGKYMLTGIGIAGEAEDFPAAAVIKEAPSVYITGAPGKNSSGFVYASRVGSANWNYDRVAMEAMNFMTVRELDDADVIAGASSPGTAALESIKKGMPYIGYGSSANGTNNGRVGSLFASGAITYSSCARGSMDTLGYVTYPEKTLVNASNINSGDDMLYGYGTRYYSAYPDGAKALVKFDGTKEATEGFVVAIDSAGKASAEAYFDSVQGFSYEGADKDGNEINIALFANSLTHKGHQTDEYSYISNFIFSNMLGEEEYTASAKTSSGGGHHGSSGNAANAQQPVDNTTGTVITTGSAVQTGSFSDVKSNSWYHSAVEYVSSKGIMTGVSGNSFGPNIDTTRGMIVTILYRLENQPAGAEAAAFGDVKATQYYANAIAWANANGIVTGYGNGLFGPNDAITREQMAAILYRYAQYKGYDVSASADLTAFSDAVNVSGYAVDAMKWANAAGLINGVTSSTLVPENSAVRAQAASILMRFCENIK